MGLHDGGLAIDIDDESGQQVALAMHETVGVVLRIIGHADGNAHPKGRLQAGIPELVVDGHIVERQDAHGDGTGLIVAYGQKGTVAADDPDHLTVGEVAVSLLDGSREHPRMEAQETIFLSPFELQVLHKS